MPRKPCSCGFPPLGNDRVGVKSSLSGTIFKAADPQEAAQEEDPEQEASEDAEAMADEPAVALAA